MTKPFEDLYALLGVVSNATNADIDKAFRKASILCHPDKLPEGEKASGEAKFKKLSAARDVLADPEQRQKYDSERKAHQKSKTTTTLSREEWARETQQEFERIAKELARLDQERARMRMRQQADLDRSWKLAKERIKAAEAAREQRTKAAAEATAHYANSVKSSYIPTDPPPRRPEWKLLSKMTLSEIITSTTSGTGAPTAQPTAIPRGARPGSQGANSSPQGAQPTPQTRPPTMSGLGRRTPLSAPSHACLSQRNGPTSPFAFGRPSGPLDPTSPFSRVPSGGQYTPTSPQPPGRQSRQCTPTSPVPSVEPTFKRKLETEATGEVSEAKRAKVDGGTTA